MFAKMGYVEGTGLGADGRGIINPIEQKLREGRLGLGGMNEKTKQSRDEDRRNHRTENNDESQRQHKRNAPRKPKVKYRTVEEIEASGLPVPSLWKNIIDLTGPDTKVLDDMSGFKGIDVPINEESENARLVDLARRDLEMYAEEWQGLQARRKYIETEQSRLTNMIDNQTESILRTTRVLEIVSQLQSITGTDMQALVAIGQKLETLQFEYPEELDRLKLDDVAVAAINPVIRSLTLSWDPLTNPNFLKDHLLRWQKILRIHKRDALVPDSIGSNDNYLHRNRHILDKNRASMYESMMAEIWLPCVRRALLNEWDVFDPTPVVALFEEWQPILPSFIQSQLLEQIVLPKLHEAVLQWTPPRKRAQDPPSNQPHHWIFPWMPLLGAHLDSVVSDVRHKFRSILRTWDPLSGVLDGLDAWREVFGRELDSIVKHHILPKIADVFRVTFQINPADQSMSEFVTALKWRRFFKLSVFASMLRSSFFPKWWDVLYLWLTSSEPDAAEINRWFEFWTDQFPSDLRDAPAVKDAFKKGRDLIARAQYLGSRAQDELKPIIDRESTKSRAPEAKPPPSSPQPDKSKQEPLPASIYKDVVEEYCLENNLLFMPLRKAHDTLGHPLYRITASGSGKGGFVCYFEYEVLWAKNKGNDPDQLEWEPLDFYDIEELAHFK
ncbi:GC-rich sequence DNA-binding factor-like protein-domain-containing protein [Lipomyces arxii]|uniref:GC-rich sequence DNA-binding factor-like protein-domain-containing protein n=1 Tax=Lipomyces arxii TaxID=56418 RepID=UPI0034CE93B7